MLIEILGWFGAGMILWGYYLVSTKRDKPTGRRYQMVNLIGGLALIVNAYFRNAFAFIFLNFVWVAIAVKILLRRK